MTDPNASKNARIGILLFCVYSLFYLGFVLVNAFAPDLADWKPVAGLNLAIIWGFSLIALALILALIYGAVCSTDRESAHEKVED